MKSYAIDKAEYTSVFKVEAYTKNENVIVSIGSKKEYGNRVSIGYTRDEFAKLCQDFLADYNSDHISKFEKPAAPSTQGDTVYNTYNEAGSVDIRLECLKMAMTDKNSHYPRTPVRAAERLYRYVTTGEELTEDEQYQIEMAARRGVEYNLKDALGLTGYDTRGERELCQLVFNLAHFARERGYLIEDKVADSNGDSNG